MPQLPQETVQTAGNESRKAMILILGIVVALLVGAAFLVMQKQPAAPAPAAPLTSTGAQDGKTVLTYAVHWDDYQVEGIKNADGTLKEKGLRQYVEEYEALHPEIDIHISFIDYSDYANSLRLLHQADAVPDIYQIYSPWGVSFAREGMLAAVPENLKSDIAENYVTTSGVEIDGEIRGIPTEVNDHVLLYNKDLVKVPPKTWDELVDVAADLAERDAEGRLTRYGFAFLPGFDSFVSDPFLSLLYSNKGEYLSKDLKTCLLDQPAGVEALDAILELFRRGATDLQGNIWEFAKGKVAMIIMPPWTEGDLRREMGADFDRVVGTAPLPPLKEPASLQYSWFMGVMEKSRHQAEAWEFLRWFTTEVRPESGTTRYSDLLAKTIGAIPSRANDIVGLRAYLADDPFVSTFVAELPNSVAEPNVAEAESIKGALMNEIQAAWAGQKTAEEALDEACVKIDAILAAAPR